MTVSTQDGIRHTMTARTRKDSDVASTGAIVTSAVAVSFAADGRGFARCGLKKLRFGHEHVKHYCMKRAACCNMDEMESRHEWNMLPPQVFPSGIPVA